MSDPSETKFPHVIVIVSAVAIGFLATLCGIWLYQNKDRIQLWAQNATPRPKPQVEVKKPVPWPRSEFDKVIEKIGDPRSYPDAFNERTRYQRKFGTTPVTTELPSNQ